MGAFSLHKGDYYDQEGEHAARCRLCGSTWNLHLHHIKRRGAGGKDTPKNRVWLCWKCHGEVHTTHDPFRRLLEHGSSPDTD